MITALQIPTSQDVAGHYDDLDAMYRDHWGDHLHHGWWETGRESVAAAVERLVAHVADALQVTAGEHVIDVGCGYGATARWLARHRDLRVTGVTLSAVQQAYAASRGDDRDRVRIRVEDWLANSFPDASCDGLVSIECLSHVEDKPMYFDQIARVLRPGRRAAITAWLAVENPSRWQRNWLLRPICAEGRLAGIGCHAEYTAMIEAAGLRLLEFQEVSRQVRKTWRICARRLWWGICTRPDYWRLLWRLNRSSHTIFAISVYRILAAYYLGAMQYGFYVLEKPAAP